MDARNTTGLARSTVIPRITAFTVIGALPALTFIIFPTKLFEITEIDPWIYLGYINDFGATTARFGSTYYGNRIAYIMAEKIFFSTLGPILGHFVFAYLLLTAAAAAAYAIGARFYSSPIGLIGAAWLCLTPWLPHSVFHTYVDGSATTYLLIGIALLTAPSRWRLSSHAFAGTMFALSVNCNSLLLAVGSTFIPGWFYLYRTEGARWVFLAIVTVASGFVATYLCLGLLMYIASAGQLPFFFDVTAVRTSVALLHGAAATWFVPLTVLLSNPGHYYLLIPPTFLCVVAAIVLRSYAYPFGKRAILGSPLSVFAAVHLFLIILLALFLHSFFKIGWLAYDFYMIYFFPGCLLALICATGEAAAVYNSSNGRSLSFAIWVCASAVLLVTPTLRSEILQEISAHGTLDVWFLLAVLTIIVTIFARGTAILSGLVIVLMAGNSLIFYSAQSYFGLLNGDSINSDIQRDGYEAALFLQNYVNQNVPTGTPLRFWYRSGGSETTWLDSVQSMFLWSYSRLAAFDAKDAGMPIVNEAFYKNVSGAGALILLGENNAELDRGEASLITVQAPFKEVKRSKYLGKRVSLYIAILFPEGMAGGRSIPVNEAIRASNNASLHRIDEGVSFRTLPAPWSYIARMPLRADCVAGAGWVAADLSIKQGRIGIGVLNRRGDIFLTRGSVGAAEKTQTVILWLQSFAAVGDLVIQNWNENLSSAGTIEAVRVSSNSPELAECHT